MVGELLVGFQDVAFMPSRVTFLPCFFIIVVEVEALGRPRVSKLSLGVSKGMLPGRYFCVS